ncbi:6760_t:CDS:1, partial [Gigaspora rosea]
CSTTILGSEVRRYIKDHGNITFRGSVVFDEYSEFKSAIDILNNLRDNSILYHDILASKRSVDRIFAFYLTVAEANSFSAYCQFVPGKQNTRHVDFRKQLAGSIFDYYSNASVAIEPKKDEGKFQMILNIGLLLLIMILEHLASKANMYNIDVWGVIPVQLPVVVVQFHAQCVQIAGPGISICLILQHNK